MFDELTCSLRDTDNRADALEATMPQEALPANPMSIELGVEHRRLWWQTTDDDEHPERWDVSADVGGVDACPDEQRHVGEFSLALADLDPDRNLLDSVEVGQWALEFIAETVLDLADGTLVAELDAQISEGPARMLILQWFELAEAWRGHGLAGPLVAAALEQFSQMARLAVCRIAIADFMGDYPDRLSAELASVRAGAILERIGFYRWNGVHVVDLRNPALIDARLDPLLRWAPDPSA